MIKNKSININNENKILKPFYYDNKYYIVQIIKHNENINKTYEEAKKEIKEALTLSKKKEEAEKQLSNYDISKENSEIDVSYDIFAI